MIFTAGFNPSIIAKTLGANLTVLSDNKDLALKQKLWKEKRKLTQMETVSKLIP
jgi:hypothetical protein